MLKKFPLHWLGNTRDHSDQGPQKEDITSCSQALWMEAWLGRVHPMSPTARHCSPASSSIPPEKSLLIVSSSWCSRASDVHERPQPERRHSTFLPRSLPDQERGCQPLLPAIPVSSQSLRYRMLFSVFLPKLPLSFHLCFSPGPHPLPGHTRRLICSWHGSTGPCPWLQCWSMSVTVMPWVLRRGPLHGPATERSAWPIRGSGPGSTALAFFCSDRAMPCCYMISVSPLFFLLWTYNDFLN